MQNEVRFCHPRAPTLETPHGGHPNTLNAKEFDEFSIQMKNKIYEHLRLTT